MSSITGRSDMGTSSEAGGRPSAIIHTDQDPTALAGCDVEVDDGGQCSDSDALLPPLKKPLAADASAAANSNSISSQRSRKISSTKQPAEMGLFGEENEACSPLLLSTPSDTLIIPGLTHATSPAATTTDDDSASSFVSNSHSQSSTQHKTTDHDTATTPFNNSSSNAPRIVVSGDAIRHREQGSSDGFSAAELSRRSPSPRIDIGIRQQDTQSSSPVNNHNSRSYAESPGCQNDSPIQQYSPQNPLDPHSQVNNNSLPYMSTTQEVEGFLPNSILHNPPFVSGPISVSSAPSSNSSRDTTGLGNLRRFVRSRATARTRTTAESSSSQMSTQSLGDEDLFALTLNGDDPRLPVGSSQPPAPVVPPQTPSQRDLWDAARMQSSEHFPPIVWEESSDSEAEIRERRRRRAFSEPGGTRLRGFRLAISPGVRRRGSRQSRSVRRHLPRSSSTSSANMSAASPLSTTAAAVLFTSSQASQASVDSLRRSSRPQSRQRPSGSTQLRMPSAASLDDSARAGVGTSHRSIVMDGGGADALSISTIGNSTMARSERAGGGDSARQSQGNSGPRASGRHLRENDINEVNDGGDDDSGNSADPTREARVRWVRINQRFQLMITFVAVCFSLLLFSILISWIVLTSAFVVTFQKECDIPLKFFYWSVTLQLILDVFRNDIMRYILQWDPAAQSPDSSQQFIPARVLAYNIGYLTYALLVLRMGINCVYIEGQQPQTTCRDTAPELFQSSFVFVTLELAAWATIILGYLVPFCFVATLLTLNGYNPGETEDGVRIGTSTIPGGVFPSAYSNNGAPPGTVEKLREVELGDIDEQECCICMEDFRTGRHNDYTIIKTPCEHTLHKSCCSVWLRQARTCPVCRTDIPNAQAERLRQEQVELGDSNRNRQQQLGQERHPQSPSHHQRAPVAPRLTGAFRPAGRQEVATLIRAFRQPRRQRHRGGRRRGSGPQASGRSERSRASVTDGSTGRAGSSRREHPQSDHNEEPATSNIEITSLSRRGDSSSSIEWSS